jgi:hypothetical protein
MRLTLMTGAGQVEALVDAIPDSVTMSVAEYGPDQLRASFIGRFSYAPVNGAATHVTVSGEAEVARYMSR